MDSVVPRVPPSMPRFADAPDSFHERDARITFDEPTHAYYLDGEHKFSISCTGYVHGYFPHFDAQGTAAKLAAKPDSMKKPEYAGKTAEELVAMWKASGDKASSYGTRMHFNIETFFKTGAMPLEFPTVEDVVEWNQFVDFLEHVMVPYGWEPWRSEWRVFDEELDLAGSIDFVVRTKDPATGEYVFIILDWKRAKELTDRSFNGREMGKRPLHDLQHCNSVHYSLQLNTYKYMLEKNYGIRVVGLALVAMHGEVRTEYEFKQCPDMPEHVARMVNDRKAKLGKK